MTVSLYRLGDIPSGVLFRLDSRHPYAGHTCSKLSDRESNIHPDHRSELARVLILDGGLLGARVGMGTNTLVEVISDVDTNQQLVGGHIVLEKTYAEYIGVGDRIVTPKMYESYQNWLQESLAGNNQYPFNFGVTEVIQTRQLVNDQSGCDEIRLGLVASTNTNEFTLSLTVSADTELWLETARITPVA